MLAVAYSAIEAALPSAQESSLACHFGGHRFLDDTSIPLLHEHLSRTHQTNFFPPATAAAIRVQQRVPLTIYSLLHLNGSFYSRCSFVVDMRILVRADTLGSVGLYVPNHLSAGVLNHP